MRFGLGWRAELGAGIVAHLAEIDVLEVLAEDFAAATRDQKKALRFLRSQVPVVVHGTSLGLASSEPVHARRLEDLARVVEWLEPEFWSEHLAFVRGGGLEVGHLAAPPRNEATLAGLQRNVEQARRVTGSLPHLENVASLIEPPLCDYDEASWLQAVLDATGCQLLLDLHNVHANATNFSFDASALVRSLPGERIAAVHLAGGRRIERGRILDDHLHGVPDEVFALLACVQSDPATVILERDGNYPPIEELLAELRRARAVRPLPQESRMPALRVRTPDEHTAGGERFLASLYTDAGTRERFLADPLTEATKAGFGARDAQDLASMNREDLMLAARGFEKKRAGKHRGDS